MYSIKKGNIVIRTMLAEDVASYIAKFNYPPQKRNMFYKAVKENITQRKSDEPNLYFAILENNKVIGAIAGIAFEKSLCDAVIRIDLPGREQLTDEIENLFVKLASMGAINSIKAYSYRRLLKVVTKTRSYLNR